jgi:phospholipid/cholesterol/gamma-HCH transport system permease protein
MKVIRDLLESLRNFVQQVGAVTLFFGRVLAQVPGSLAKPRLIIDQIHNAGALSLVIIMTSALMIGAVLGLTGFDLLERFASEDYLGVFGAFALVRELGPVVTSLLFAGRAGSALASEIGLMRATDQLVAMEMMAVDPMRRVVAPRFLGGVIAMPLLTAVFITIGLFGTQLVGVQWFGVDSGAFWSQIRSTVDLKDVVQGMSKGFVFGVTCSLVAVYEGYNAIPTAEGVGRATTRTVVISSVLTLMLNLLLTAMFLD